jgi:hypothetical protein
MNKQLKGLKPLATAFSGVGRELRGRDTGGDVPNIKYDLI